MKQDMQYRYQMVVCDKCNPQLILRSPAEGVSTHDLCDAICALPSDMDIKAFVVFDMVPSDFPMLSSENTIENLALAYSGNRLLLPLFDLYDYQDGKFINIQRRMRPKERLLSMTLARYGGST